MTAPLVAPILPRDICHCDDRSRWDLARSDRFCGLCGRAVVRIRPRDLPATIDGQLGIASYLGIEGDSLARLGLLVPFEPDEIHWDPDESSEIALIGSESPRPGEFEVLLTCLGPQRGPGLVGSGRLTLRGLPTDPTIRVAIYRVNEGGPRLKARGPGLDLERRVVKIDPNSPPFTIEVVVDHGPGVPIRWADLRSDHWAVRPVAIGGEYAVSPSIIQLQWDPTRWGRGVSRRRVGVQLMPWGLPPLRFELIAEEPGRSTIQADPPGLVLSSIRDDRRTTRSIMLTNRDPTRSVQVRIGSDVDWLNAADPGPFSIGPGDSRPLRVTITPIPLRDQLDSHRGRLVVMADGVGAQQFVRVLVGAVEASTPARPLLIDPGPPTIIIARPDRSGLGVEFTRRGGDSGLDPSSIGLDARVFDNEELASHRAGRIVKAAIRYALDAENWRTEGVVVVRPSWMAINTVIEGATVLDWAEIARGRFEGKADVVARVDAWETSLLVLDNDPARPPGGIDHDFSPGVCLASWLADQIRPRLKSSLGPPAAWLRVAAARFVANHGRSPDRAWRELLNDWRANVPESHYAEPDIPRGVRKLRQAIDALNKTIRCTAQSMCANDDRPVRIVVVSGLFRGDASRSLLNSMDGEVSADFTVCGMDWAAWAVSLRSERESTSSPESVGR